MFGKNTMKLAGVLSAVALLGACASTTTTSSDTLDTRNAGPSVSSVPQGPTPGSQADLENAAGHRVFFGYNQWALSTEAQNVLAAQAAWLKQYPESRVLVGGNCDERGTREYNIALGARRAEAAKSYLVSLGVDSSRITTVSYGKERPIDPRSNDSAWSVNRNATTILSTVGA